MPDKSELMVYLPASFMARFVATGQTDAALTKLYGARHGSKPGCRGGRTRR
jgi:hypothetical protein